MSGLTLQLYHRLPPAGRSAVATLRGMYLRWWRYGPDRQWLEDQALDLVPG